MFVRATAFFFLLSTSTVTAHADGVETFLNMFDGGNDISSVFGPATNKKNPRGSYRPPETYQGQWYTAPNGCSYSRAQAPGYPPSWHLILNPHHIGQKPAHAGCAAML